MLLDYDDVAMPAVRLITNDKRCLVCKTGNFAKSLIFPSGFSLTCRQNKTPSEATTLLLVR